MEQGQGGMLGAEGKTPTAMAQDRRAAGADGLLQLQ